MKPLLISLLCLSFLYASSQSDELILEKALFNLPNVSFKKISQPGDSILKYDLLVRQPLDHQHPEKGNFNQRVVLTHRGFNNPTVMETQGYWLNFGRNEVEKIFSANNLNIEYRYYGKSVPDPVNWDYLTIEQATADLHAINQLFREVYKGKWISTGISKGGSTTIYYKYFFPADVDLSIPYVAPIDDSFEDKRIYTFFDTIGTSDCRDKISQFQVFLLKNEKQALEKLKWYSKGAKLNYTYTGSIGKSFEYAVLEYPFAFWQYYINCDTIPRNKNLDDYLDELIRASDISAFSDEGIKQFEVHYYQAATQAGYYGYNIAPLRKYLKYFTENPSATFPPKSAPVKNYDPGLNQKVQQWLDQSGNGLIYIYGGNDTWTAAGVKVTNNVNSKRYVIPGTNHATARIRNMNEDMLRQFVQDIKSFTGLNVNTGALK